MTAPKHTARTSFMVRCATGQRWQHSGQFRDQGRAEHWAAQCTATCDCRGPHEVVPVAPTGLRWGGGA